jgi:nitrogen-specific signal transduction histidine kinase
VKINGTDVIQILLNLVVNAFQCTRSRTAWRSAAKCCARRWT